MYVSGIQLHQTAFSKSALSGEIVLDGVQVAADGVSGVLIEALAFPLAVHCLLLLGGLQVLLGRQCEGLALGRHLRQRSAIGRLLVASVLVVLLLDYKGLIANGGELGELVVGRGLLEVEGDVGFVVLEFPGPEVVGVGKADLVEVELAIGRYPGVRRPILRQAILLAFEEIVLNKPET